jgi:hypothetical protein
VSLHSALWLTDPCNVCAESIDSPNRACTREDEDYFRAKRKQFEVFNDSQLNPSPESGLDCLMYAILARQRTMTDSKKDCLGEGAD